MLMLFKRKYSCFECLLCSFWVCKMVSCENLFDILNEFFKVIDEMNNIVLVFYWFVDILEENEFLFGKC